ncbi:MAG: hypothetical protein WAO15_06140, partial [Mycobacterium sp.]
MDSDDPEKRIAELEHQPAAQKRIAELERQLAQAKAATGQDDVAEPADDHALRYAQALWEGLRSGEPTGPSGPSGPEMAQHREALMRAAAQAGLSQEQIDDAVQHGTVTIKVGHSVVYPGQGDTPDYGDAAGNGRRQSGYRPQRPRGKRAGADRFGTIVGMIGGAIGICVGGAAALIAVLPSSVLWMSPIVCSRPYQLAY